MLTQADTRLLAFEETHPRPTGLKNDEILHTFGLSRARYYQRLVQLAHDPEAVAAYPQVCSRVLRIAERRRRQRESLLRITG